MGSFKKGLRPKTYKNIISWNRLAPILKCSTTSKLHKLRRLNPWSYELYQTPLRVLYFRPYHWIKYLCPAPHESNVPKEIHDQVDSISPNITSIERSQTTKFWGLQFCGCQFSCFTCFIPQEIETWSWLRWVDGSWVDFVISNLSGSGATLPSTGSPVHCHYGAGVDCAKSQTWDVGVRGSMGYGTGEPTKTLTGYLEVFIAAETLQMFVFNQFHRNERIETCQQNS